MLGLSLIQAKLNLSGEPVLSAHLLTSILLHRTRESNLRTPVHKPRHTNQYSKETTKSSHVHELLGQPSYVHVLNFSRKINVMFSSTDLVNINLYDLFTK